MRTTVEKCVKLVYSNVQLHERRMPRVNVLLSSSEDARFAAYCAEQGFKKSTLIARLVREHLDQQGFAAQTSLLLAAPKQARSQAKSRPQKFEQKKPHQR